MTKKERQLKVGDRVTLFGRTGTVVEPSNSKVVTVKWDKNKRG